jgi:hypothetical protein
LSFPLSSVIPAEAGIQEQAQAKIQFLIVIPAEADIQFLTVISTAGRNL